MSGLESLSRVESAGHVPSTRQREPSKSAHEGLGDDRSRAAVPHRPTVGRGRSTEPSVELSGVFMGDRSPHAESVANLHSHGNLDPLQSVDHKQRDSFEVSKKGVTIR